MCLWSSLNYDKNVFLLDDMDSLGYLTPIPLVIIKAVPPENFQRLKEEKKDDEDSASEESEDEVSDPMPKHFEDLIQPSLSRSGSSASLESAGLLFDQRPQSACTDVSDTSVSAETIAPAPEIDESMFDVATLTCKLCSKTMKNLRTFKNHRARHLGTLNHKCPDCSKSFEGRSAVNRHLISNHNRELLSHEITNNPAAAGSSLCKPTTGVKIFKPSEMVRKTFKLNETPEKSSEKKMPELNPVTTSERDQSQDNLFDMMREGRSIVPPPSTAGQMPILLENPTPQPVKYIVGSQLKLDESSSEAGIGKDSEDVEKTTESNESKAEVAEEIIPTDESKSEVSHSEVSQSEEIEEIVSTETNDEKKKNEAEPVDETKTVPPEIANMEKIIPESDSDSDSDSSSSSSSSDSDSSSDDDSEKNDEPEEILIEDDEPPQKVVEPTSKSTNPVPVSPAKNEYLNAFQSFLKTPNKECDSNEDVIIIKEDDEIKVTSPLIVEGEESSPVEEDFENIRVVKPDEGANADAEASVLNNQITSLQKRPNIRQRKKPSEPEEEKGTAKSRGVTVAKNKVSMVARIFNAKKREETKYSEEKKQNAAFLQKKAKDESAKKVSVAETERTDTDSNDDSNADVEAQEEADKLLEKKGVSVVGGKLMIPADKLKIPDELCKIKLIGRTNKRYFFCEICEKSYNRADKMKYHLYNDHYEDFIRCSDSVPKILKKKLASAALEAKPTPTPSTKPLKEKSVSKPSALARVFKKKESKKEATLPIKQRLPRSLARSRTLNERSTISAPETEKVSSIKASSPSKSATRPEKIKSPIKSMDDFSPKSTRANRPHKNNGASPNTEKNNLSESTKLTQMASQKSPSLRSNISPEEVICKDDITTDKLSVEEPGEQSACKNKVELNHPDTENGDSPILLPLEPVPCEVDVPVKKKRGRKKKVDIEKALELSKKEQNEDNTPRSQSPIDEFNILSVTPSTRKTRAMFEEDLTPPEIIVNEESLVDNDKSRKPLKSCLKSSSSSRPSIVQKVMFNLPDPIYDSEGKEIVKERKKLVESLPTRFPKQHDDTPNFGMNKDFVTFADLALQSKCEVERLQKEYEKQPLVHIRKKVSARLSVEQSNIEDTPSLLASETTKLEDEQTEDINIGENHKVVQEELEILEILEVSEKVLEKEDIEEPKVAEVSDDDEEISDDLPESLKILLGEACASRDDESRPTRSKLHVDTIGLHSSTLDLELHALRNLVFNEILKEKYDNGESNLEVEEENIKDIKPVDGMLEKGLETVEDSKQLVNVVPLTEYEEEKINKVDRFISLGKSFRGTIRVLQSQIWHQRKRLRIEKSSEYRKMLANVPKEKQKNFKPKRYDYSLEILCKNNLYDNIIYNMNEMMERHIVLTERYMRKKPFDPLVLPRYSIVQKDESKLVLTRKTKSHYSCTVDDVDLKLNFKKVLAPKPIFDAPTEKTIVGMKEEEVQISPMLPPPKKRGRKPKALAVIKDDLLKEKDNILKEKITSECVDSKAAENHQKKLSTKESDLKPVNAAKRGRKPKNTNSSQEPLKKMRKKGRPKKVIAGEVNLEVNTESLKSTTERSSVEDEGILNLIAPKKRGRKRKLDVENLKKKILIKKCKISGNLSSEGEEQVPLKITFKRPAKKEDGSRSEAIKLRVKTQTTSDHGFNIQIQQPKTDNPVKFKLKTSGDVRRSRKVGKSLEDIAGKLAILSEKKSNMNAAVEISSNKPVSKPKPESERQIPTVDEIDSLAEGNKISSSSSCSSDLAARAAPLVEEEESNKTFSGKAAAATKIDFTSQHKNKITAVFFHYRSEYLLPIYINSRYFIHSHKL